MFWEEAGGVYWLFFISLFLFRFKSEAPWVARSCMEGAMQKNVI